MTKLEWPTGYDHPAEIEEIEARRGWDGTPPTESRATPTPDSYYLERHQRQVLDEAKARLLDDHPALRYRHLLRCQ